ncbi:D-amino acid dehydrogenase small subunit [Luteibacter rhizovicinus]|uniref:D-amino acid dehydrogenase small subunit n=1 Tax=Luteibacter rhizovicinus TaxID=242606 RepID=A0A4R3YWQ5_9GAMM|nr:FAD-dependent oxidoreductase [Luteibacter rhizovicinus]TCV97121.1 D-amino acid dehydrogenase small subunit [Luteibacter rhizovicinus]
MDASRSDVLILGGGVIGLACALYLLRSGVSVRVLEQGFPGSGSSHGNCGTITPSHAAPLTMPGMVGTALRSLLHRDAPLYVNPRPDLDRLRWLFSFARHCTWRDFNRAGEARGAILARSRALMGELIAQEGLDCEFDEVGELYVYRSARVLDQDRHHVELLDRLGMAVQSMTGDEVLAMEPALREGVVGGLYHAGDARLRPDRYVAELARRVRELGGKIETGARVDHFGVTDNRITYVRTTGGIFTGDRVVMALGAWSPPIGRMLGLRLPMQPGKGYSLTYDAAPVRAPRHSLVLREAAVCVTTWASGYRLGSTMEFSGYEEGLNDVRLDALRRGAATFLHEPEGRGEVVPWWGWRPMSVDEVPIIGPSSRWSNLVFATGHGMLGISMSAATGELVAGLLAGPAPVLDPAPFSPARFGL